MGAPVTLSGANAPTPTFIAPIVTSDTVLGFSLKVMDDHGAIGTNPAVVYVMIKHANNTHTQSLQLPALVLVLINKLSRTYPQRLMICRIHFIIAHTRRGKAA